MPVIFNEPSQVMFYPWRMRTFRCSWHRVATRFVIEKEEEGQHARLGFPTSAVLRSPHRGSHGIIYTSGPCGAFLVGLGSGRRVKGNPAKKNSSSLITTVLRRHILNVLVTLSQAYYCSLSSANNLHNESNTKEETNRSFLNHLHGKVHL